jgi:hypothetical protein
MFCKKVKMESSKRTKGGSIGAREESKLLYYKAIPPTKNVSDFNPTMWKNSILHYENKNLIKADWLTMWILKMFYPQYVFSGI